MSPGGHVAAGQDEFKSMMPMCCNDALAILFIFDLSRKSTLASIRKWFKESRRYSKARRPHLRVSAKCHHALAPRLASSVLGRLWMDTRMYLLEL